MAGAMPGINESGTVLLEESCHLLSSQELDTGDGFLVSDDDTNLRGRHTLFSHGDDQIADGSGGVCDPTSGSSFEGSDS